MGISTPKRRSALVKATFGVACVCAALPALCQPIPANPSPEVRSPSSPPSIALPSRYRNQPEDALSGRQRDRAFGEPELARLIALALRYSPVRAQAIARLNAVRTDFLRGGDAEKRALEAELARVDEQLAEEVAHAWFDGRAADARLGVARTMDSLAAQGLLLVNQRLGAGLATQADLERFHEAAIRARALAARAAQERSAAVARIAALGGEQIVAFTAEPAAERDSPPPYAIPASPPALLLDRHDVRAARIRATLAQENRHASAAELAASYREALQNALEETENAYAHSVNARAQRRGAAELAAAAARQTAAVLVQLEAGRVGRLLHIEAQLNEQDVQLRSIDAEAAYAKALATLEKALGGGNAPPG